MVEQRNLTAATTSSLQRQSHGRRNDRLRVLVAAHEFSPVQGSECAVGWNIVTRLAQYHDVTLLCASGSQVAPHSYRDAFESFVSKNGPIQGLKVIFVDQPTLSRFLTRINKCLTGVSDGTGLKLLFRWALKAWNRACAQTAREIGIRNFDIVHHLNPLGFWGVGKLWSDANIFCWGPVGGTCTIPFRYAPLLGWRSATMELMRSIQITCSGMAFKRVLKNTDAVWAVSSAERDTIVRLSGKVPIQMTETGSLASDLCRQRHFDPRRPLLLCWSGRHIRLKALPILLHAVASSKCREHFRVLVLGGGPETTNWKRLASILGIASQVSWLGNVPHADALREMQRADVLVHTSLREGTPHVVLEALAMGMPVVCHDACGMGSVVNSCCGIKVGLSSPEQSIAGFREAIERFWLSPSPLEELSLGASKKASELTWDQKAKEISDTYSSLVSAATDRKLRDR